MMIEVKLLTGRVGNNFSQIRGDVIEVADGEALRMVAAGHATAANAEAKKALEDLRKRKPQAQPADEPADESGETSAEAPQKPSRSRKK